MRKTDVSNHIERFKNVVVTYDKEAGQLYIDDEENGRTTSSLLCAGGEMRGFRVWSDYWEKYATEAALYMDGSADAVFEDDGGVPHHENIDLVLEFDTGLKDKNGEEICEGDIVVNTYYDDGEMYKILWVDDSVAFGMESLDDMELYKLPLESLEVIGNVHENHELLEEKE